MSENKCPCCGDTISIFTDSGFYECDSCPFMCALADLPRIAAAMKAEARHNALMEAVKQMAQLETQLWTNIFEDEQEYFVAKEEYAEARAEVDLLIANESAPDCKGEG